MPKSARECLHDRSVEADAQKRTVRAVRDQNSLGRGIERDVVDAGMTGLVRQEQK
jgi:hypothetical protein